MLPLQTMPFDCDRTCPDFERRVDGHFWCRFRPLLDRLGPVKVHSHTALLKVEYTDPDALKIAVERMGGLWYGFDAKHDLFDTKQTGWGFRLPMAEGLHKTADGRRFWYHPLVLRADGQLAYDSYGGEWGDVSQLETLKSEYAFAMTEKAALDLGWLTERVDGRLVVHHPSGGTLSVSADGKLETQGFVGGACHQAREALGLPVEEGSIVGTAEGCQVPAIIEQIR